MTDAIEVAAKAIDGQNKIHSHQRRVGRKVLNIFREQLKLKEADIGHAANFDQLLAIIETIKCYRIGDLTCYATATRIGAYRNLFPGRIYLHAGTRTGAMSIIGNISGRKYIMVDDLPNEFLQYRLTASDLEDILCIFKDDFKQGIVR